MNSSWSHTRADPLHAEVLLRSVGLGMRTSPGSQNGAATGSGADRKRMSRSVSSQMPPNTKEFRFSENLCHEAGLRSDVTLK